MVETGTLRVAVVGGGVSGLTTAFYLARRGIACTIYEKNSELGGLIRTDQELGCVLEAGPDSFIRIKTSLQQLAHDLDAGDQLIPTNDAERRVFIVHNRQLTPMPPGMSMMVPTDLDAIEGSPLFSQESRQRILDEQTAKPKTRDRDFSIGELVSEHFGEELLRTIAEPLLAGVYGGDPASLSAPSVLPRFVEYEQSFGSLVVGARSERRAAASNESLFLSFRDGMGQLISLLQERVQDTASIRHEEAQSLTRTPSGWLVDEDDRAGEFTHVVVATPAYRAARLLQSTDPYLSRELSGIPYSSAILVTLLFNADSITHPLNGFGFLVPSDERRTVAAATWINRKFPSRVAEGLVAIRAFLVDPEASALATAKDVTLVDSVRADLLEYMGISAEPVHSAVYRWPASMPQYVVGHGERRARIMNRVSSHRGLYLVSNYFDGVGIPDCVRWGRSTAVAISDSLRPS